MPRNISRLNGLVKIRKLIEDQRRVELAVLREKEYIAEEKLSHLQMEQRWSQDQLQKNKNREGNTASYLSYLDVLSQRSLYQTKLIKELQMEIEKARQALLDSSKSRKMIEKLLNKEIQRNRQNMEIQERKHLDEIAAIRFIRDNIQ